MFRLKSQYIRISKGQRTITQLFQPFIVSQQVASQEAKKQLYKRAMEEMRSVSFRTMVYDQTTWGQKPL